MTYVYIPANSDEGEDDNIVCAMLVTQEVRDEVAKALEAARRAHKICNYVESLEVAGCIAADFIRPPAKLRKLMQVATGKKDAYLRSMECLHEGVETFRIYSPRIKVFPDGTIYIQGWSKHTSEEWETHALDAKDFESGFTSRSG